MTIKSYRRVLLPSLLLVGFAHAAGAAEKITWKPVLAAVLKVDNQPVKLWNVYVAHKKDHLVLVQLGWRFLMLDTELRQVVEVAPASLERKGEELRWERREAKAPDKEADTTTKPGGTRIGKAPAADTVLPSDGWNIRDAGRARIIRARLTDEGRVLEVQLPLAPDQRFY